MYRMARFLSAVAFLQATPKALEPAETLCGCKRAFKELSLLATSVQKTENVSRPRAARLPSPGYKRRFDPLDETGAALLAQFYHDAIHDCAIPHVFALVNADESSSPNDV